MYEVADSGYNGHEQPNELETLPFTGGTYTLSHEHSAIVNMPVPDYNLYNSERINTQFDKVYEPYLITFDTASNPDKGVNYSYRDGNMVIIDPLDQQDAE